MTMEKRKFHLNYIQIHSKELVRLPNSLKYHLDPNGEINENDSHEKLQKILNNECENVASSKSKNRRQTQTQSQSQSQSQGQTQGQTQPKNILSQKDQEVLWKNKSWEIAKSPIKQLFMTAFMLYMSGTSIQIFPIIMLIMSLLQPIRAIFNLNNTFKFFEEKNIDTRLQKTLFIIFQFVAIGLVVMKCYYMKLLPSEIDWMPIEYIPSKEISKGIII